MKIFTKSLLTLLLLCVAGVVSAQAPKKLTVLSPNGERDWTKQTDYGYYYDTNWSPSDFTYELAGDDGLHLNNPTSGQFQLFLLDWANQTQGDDYVVRIWLKADGAGSGNLSIGTWSGNTNVAIEWEASDDFVMIEKPYTGGVTNSASEVHILFQSSFVGEIYVQKAQLLGYEEIKPEKSNFGEWVSLINNGDISTDEVEGIYFISRDGENTTDAPDRPEIVAGGVEGNCLKVVSDEAAIKSDDSWCTWSSQFYVRFNEPVIGGTKYRLSFYAKSDVDAKVTTSAQAEPRKWLGAPFIDEFNVTDEWQKFEASGTINSSWDQKSGDEEFHCQSLCFDLNQNQASQNFYFDNFVFEKFVPLDDATFNDIAIKILFTENTNLVRLLTTGAPGKTRLIFPNDCVTVKANDEVMPIGSVECDATGALMIFLDEDWIYDNDKVLTADTKVEISLKNPADEKFHIVKLNSDNTEGDALEDKELTGRYDGSLNIKSDAWNKPSLVSADPEDGSFHMDAATNEFTLTFDKKVICSQVVAKLDGTALTVEPATGLAETIKVKYAGAALAEGEHTVTIDKLISSVWDGALEQVTPDEIASAELTFSVGAKEMDATLATALDDARAALYDDEGAMIDRYAGDAATTLDAAIKKYEVEGVDYTAPTVLGAATLDLRGKLKAFNTHKSNCDTYDKNLSDAQTLVENYSTSKFAAAELFQTLKTSVEKFAAMGELTDDEQLTTANEELQQSVKPAKTMFTVADNNSPSKTGTTGIAALVERIRLGAETLKKLGATDNDELIVAADNALTDDDHLANLIKQQIKLRLYEELKNPESTLLTPETEGEEEVKTEIDMSVFIKNPNVYRVSRDMSFNATNLAGNVPTGWTCNSATGDSKLSDGWSQQDADISDTMFEGWDGSYDVSQTIEDLPAGVYTLNFAFGQRDDKTEEQLENIVAYAVFGTDSIAQPAPIIGQNFPTIAERRTLIEDITVVDGTLKLGLHVESARPFCDGVQLLLTAPADGFNYVMAYESYSTAIDAAAAAPKVRAIELYDLNGRRIAKAQKGLAIVKKVMSDGSIKTDKVVK